MKEITRDELNEILRKHNLWIKGDFNGERADLYGADLREADLREANLSWADLRGANLSWADLREADLRGANLYGADLREANLREANLSWADLREADLYEANLSWADLRGANLRGANLYGADLRGADLREANLRGADLRGADLRGANLYEANLRGANLRGAKNLNFPIACPEKGSFIGFKKCRNGMIVKLEITEDALRCSATGRKCRCSKAKVLSITNLDGTDPDIEFVSSKLDPFFIYKVGEIVEVKDFDTNRWNECSTGIHFFITRQEAVDYSG